ncbi:hypothetical protein BC939DRAFT_437335 [Gamsiella multidivaricata]|uniref:uncharacterized protein n=1 Tax=Gamsiella multidivaricata TaxID=101098 RepID=UPI0022206600|nr:uncharacterized protein BC939DRAFT_437335 [Gamsiella multidivaricata]KAG0362489.1 F-box and leucine-rich repeat protein 4 [Gamsiella multidivaricata]KAI7831531.1 hypothetical protein BC939DRAFT_437335 [Gamsiella multidivaricata]
MNELPSSKVLEIPEILCMVIDVLDGPSLKTASLVCKAWHRQTRLILWRQLVIPKDWYNHDLTPLWSTLDRQGDVIRVLSLELSTSAKMKQEVDMELIRNQLASLLSRAPNLESLNMQLPRDIKSNIARTIAAHSKQLKQLETDILNWESDDMADLLTACPNLRQIAGHNFSGDILKAIARTQPTLDRLDCTHPRFDDEELIAFVKQFPDLLQLSVSLHQFLTTKALIGIAQHCQKIEHLGFHFCLGLQSVGFQAIFQVSTNLRVLDLGPSEVRNPDIALVAAQCPSLETLKLPFCANITHESIIAIVHSCQHLRHLDLSWCDKVLLSIFDMEAPWVCEKLQYLDISGIHALYSVEASMASALLPSMYHQLSLLTQLQHLKISGHGFSLRLLDLGRPALSNLRHLETLDVSKLKNPIPWRGMIEIGNLFPGLKEFQFRSSDVIPPISAEEKAAIRNATERHARGGPFTATQPMPGEASDEAGPSTLAGISSVASSAEVEATTTEANITQPAPKRRRSRSPIPSPSGMTPSNAISPAANVTRDDTEPVVEQTTDSSDIADEDEDQPMSGVMRATLRSGLEISFRMNGEDEEEGPDGGEDMWGFPNVVSYYG